MDNFFRKTMCQLTNRRLAKEGGKKGPINFQYLDNKSRGLHGSLYSGATLRPYGRIALL